MKRFQKGLMFQNLLRQFGRHKRGNIAVVGALTAIPLTMGLGIGVDYAVAGFRQDQINGMADAATLAGVTPTMMSTQTAVASQATAQNMFMSQLSTIPNIDLAHSSATVTSNDVSNGTTVTRTVTLHYTVASKAMFGQLLGMSALTVGGQATAVSSTAPNINFWMLLDDSPSMAIAATPAGISTMVSNTPSQGGCAFACHEVNPASEGLGNPGGEDNYTLARNLGVPLRIDNVNTAVQGLLTTAAQTQMSYHTTYKFALYTMDINSAPVGTYGQPSVLTASQISHLSISALEVWSQGCVSQFNCNNDTDSYLDGALINTNLLMPTPGGGSNNVADTPQEVLFIVSDGVNDYYSGGTRLYNPIGQNASICTAIKNRGIRIAYLYTTYYPLPTNGWYNTYIAPIQPTIGSSARNCASPGLYFEVSTGGDISAAMQTLFQRAVATARLTV